MKDGCWWVSFSEHLWRVQSWEIDEAVAFNLSGARRSCRKKRKEDQLKQTRLEFTTRSRCSVRDNLTIAFSLRFFLTPTSFSSSVSPHLFFEGVYDKRQLVTGLQDMGESRVVIHGVAGEAEQGGPHPIAALIQHLQQKRLLGSKVRTNYKVFGHFILLVLYILAILVWILWQNINLKIGETLQHYRGGQQRQRVLFFSVFFFLDEAQTFTSSLKSNKVPLILCWSSNPLSALVLLSTSFKVDSRFDAFSAFSCS